MSDEFSASRFSNPREQARAIARAGKRAQRKGKQSSSKGFGGDIEVKKPAAPSSQEIENRGFAILEELQAANKAERSELLRQTLAARRADMAAQAAKQQSAAQTLSGMDFMRDIQMIGELENEGILPKGTLPTENIDVRRIAGSLISDTEGLIPGPLVAAYPPKEGQSLTAKIHLHKSDNV